jgi:hypothetical protein
VRVDRIDTRRVDFGVGVLRGVLSRPDLNLTMTATDEIELAIEHVRAAARQIENLQRLQRRRRRRRR